MKQNLCNHKPRKQRRVLPCTDTLVATHAARTHTGFWASYLTSSLNRNWHALISGITPTNVKLPRTEYRVRGCAVRALPRGESSIHTPRSQWRGGRGKIGGGVRRYGGPAAREGVRRGGRRQLGEGGRIKTGCKSDSGSLSPYSCSMISRPYSLTILWSF